MHRWNTIGGSRACGRVCLRNRCDENGSDYDPRYSRQDRGKPTWSLSLALAVVLHCCADTCPKRHKHEGNDEHIQYKGKESSLLWIGQVISDKGLLGDLVQRHDTHEGDKHWHPAEPGCGEARTYHQARGTDE